MTSFVSGAGEVQIVHAGLKIGAGGGNVDNFRSGSTGNILAEIDLTTGVLGRPLGAVSDVHALEGAVVPDWREACDLVRTAALHLLPQRTMGFDIALTPRGPVVVEANRGYDPFPTPRFGDVVRAMERAVRDGASVRLEGVV